MFDFQCQSIFQLCTWWKKSGAILLAGEFNDYRIWWTHLNTCHSFFLSQLHTLNFILTRESYDLVMTIKLAISHLCYDLRLNISFSCDVAITTPLTISLWWLIRKVLYILHKFFGARGIAPEKKILVDVAQGLGEPC